MPGTAYRYTLRTADCDRTPEHRFTTAPAPETRYGPVWRPFSAHAFREPRFSGAMVAGLCDGAWRHALSPVSLPPPQLRHTE